MNLLSFSCQISQNKFMSKLGVKENTKFYKRGVSYSYNEFESSSGTLNKILMCLIWLIRLFIDTFFILRFPIYKIVGGTGYSSGEGGLYFKTLSISYKWYLKQRSHGEIPLEMEWTYNFIKSIKTRRSPDLGFMCVFICAVVKKFLLILTIDGVC